MFPLKNTEAYIHANGYRSTLGKELAARDAEISELGSEIQALTNYVTDTGVKNVLNNTMSTQTVSDVSFTVNANKSITVDGLASANAIIVFDTPALKAGTTYKLTKGLNDAYPQINLNAMNGASFVKNLAALGTQGEIEFTPDYVGYTSIQAIIYVPSGTTVSNKTVYPMIREATITDPTYQPYAKTNVELTQLGLKQVYSKNVNPVSDPDQYLKRIELTVTTGNKAELLIFSASLSANNVAPIKMTLRTSSIIEERVCPDTSRIWDFYAQTRFIHIPLMQASNTTITYELWGQWSGASNSEGAYMEIERIGI